MAAIISTPSQGRRLTDQIIANPAAGAEVIITVPTGRLWEVVHLNCQLVCAGVGGNRRLSLGFGVGIAPFTVGIFHDTVGPGVTNINYWDAGYHEYFDFAAVNETYQAIPAGLILAPGEYLRTVTVNIQAGDQYSNILFAYYETLIG